MRFSFLYNLLTFAAVPFALLYHWYRSISRGRRPAFGERFGRLPGLLKATLTKAPVIWLHAVSVGEVIAVRPLLRSIRTAYPDHTILLSATTETGRNLAEEDRLADAVIYFPFDILPAVRRLLDAASPELIVVMETEIWPVFVTEAHRRGIPLFLANGRISARSFPRYRALSWFFRPILHQFSMLAMQSDADMERIVEIGAPPVRTTVLGNLKYDIPWGEVKHEERTALRKRFGISESSLVITIGSTHPGEEEMLLKGCSGILARHHDIQLIIVPRHPERGKEVESLLSVNGLASVRRSMQLKVNTLPLSGKVLLVDTIGELMYLYALSDIAFVGGSLVPAGGHNLLEPASRGIPFMFGPYMENFREITSLVIENGAGIQVADFSEFEKATDELITTPEMQRILGYNGLKLLRTNGGAVARHLEAIERLKKG